MSHMIYHMDQILYSLGYVPSNVKNKISELNLNFYLDEKNGMDIEPVH